MNRFDTHEIFNQAPPFGDINLFRCDPALREGLAREGAGWAAGTLDALGAWSISTAPAIASTRSNSTRPGTL
jgi:hypothetical protein